VRPFAPGIGADISAAEYQTTVPRPATDLGASSAAAGHDRALAGLPGEDDAARMAGLLGAALL
jgi:hypothetical protein